MKTWQIDDAGRIFHEGRFVTQIEQQIHPQGNDAVFLVRAVTVAHPSPDEPPWKALFESTVLGTSEDVEVTAAEWSLLCEAWGSGD